MAPNIFIYKVPSYDKVATSPKADIQLHLKNIYIGLPQNIKIMPVGMICWPSGSDPSEKSSAHRHIKLGKHIQLIPKLVASEYLSRNYYTG